MKKVYLLPLLLLSILTVSAQCLVQKVALEERIHTTDYILEGKIIAQKSFWDDQYRNIYTSNTIELYKVFKGAINEYETIELITRGGVVGTDMQIDYPSLRLQVGDIGLFLLNTNNIKSKSTAKNNAIYCMSEYVSQGYLPYNLTTGKAYDGTQAYNNVPRQLYDQIEQTVNQRYRILKPFNFDKVVSSQRTSFVKNVSSFSPTTITAGTKSILTINGFGFGDIRGNVRFANADNGGSTINIPALSSQIISWTNTKIEVEVPSDAGTGLFSVTTNAGVTFSSNATLNISFSQLNGLSSFFSGGVLTSYQTQFVNENGDGGFTFRYFNDFANNTDFSGAGDAFLRAMNTWCQSTGINWIVGENTNIDVASNDGVNVVRFDNGNELPSSVLGRTTTRWAFCGDNTWYVTGIDVVFNDQFSWNTSSNPTTGGQFDLETVALHELGHAHQLGHTTNGSASSGDIMYFQVSNNIDKRTPSANDESGADDVTNRSVSNSTCSQPMMNISNCGSLPVELLSFDSDLINEEVLLFWETASEIDNAGFEIQRSQDTKKWETLDFVKGYGTTLEKQHYKYYDRSPVLGVNYYRLKQIDTDKTYEYSKLISVNLKVTKEEVMNIYPNPASVNIHIQMSQIEEPYHQFQLLDAFGRVLRTWSVKAATSYDLSIEDLPNGSYTIIAKSNRANFSHRFLKQ